MNFLIIGVFLLLWAVFFWLCALVLRDVIRFLRALPGWLRQRSRYREFEQRLRADRERITRMSPQEAEALLNPFLGMAAILTAWENPAGPSAEDTLRKLDPQLAKFLGDHRVISLELGDDESGCVNIGAELPSDAESLTCSHMPEGLLPIGISDHGELILAVRAGSPEVYHIREGAVVGEFPSIFHFILLSLTGD